MDRHRDGGRPAAGPNDSRAVRCGLRGTDRWRITTDRSGASGDDVPGAGQGPLRPPRVRHRRSQTASQRTTAGVVARPGADVHSRVDFPARSARVPHRDHHRGPGALYRDGHHLERSRPRRPGGSRRPGRDQLGDPGAVLRRAGLVLPLGAAGVAGVDADDRRVLNMADRQVGAHLPGHPPDRGLRNPALRRKGKGACVVRVDVPAQDRALGVVRVAVHHRDPVRTPGRAGHLPAMGRGADRPATTGLFRDHVGQWLRRGCGAGSGLRAHHHPGLHVSG